MLAVLFLPIVFGMKYLVRRVARSRTECAKSRSLQLQQTYLTAHGFYIRAIIYFVVWIGLMLIFNCWSRQQDVNRTDRLLRRRFKMLAGPGIILYVFVMTFAADRLGHVHLAALGVHDLRFSVRRRPADFFHVVDDRGRGSAFAHRADGRADSQARTFTTWASSF